MKQAFKTYGNVVWSPQNTACFTGHRPPKLGGYKWNSVQQNILDTLIRRISGDIRNINTYISGMALGIDTIGAMAVLHCREKMGVPVKLIAAIPYNAQNNRWPEESKRQWLNLVQAADCVIEVSQNPTGNRDAAQKLQIRNEWMVNNSSICIGVWNGVQSGGTFNCLKYAKRQGKTIDVYKVSDFENRQ